jgi:hypothetical protein
MFGRPIPENFRITFRRDVLAEALWEYGEDDLHEVQLLAVWHHVNDHDPGHGPKLTDARVMARAMIGWSEPGIRDTKRTRRRTRPKGEAYAPIMQPPMTTGRPTLVWLDARLRAWAATRTRRTPTGRT